MKTFDLQRGHAEIANWPMENRKWFFLQALDRLKRAASIRRELNGRENFWFIMNRF